MKKRAHHALLCIALLCGPAASAWAEPEKLGSDFQVNTYTTNFQGAPDAAVSSNGTFLVTWTSQGQDGDNSGIFGQEFTSAGAPLGSEFQVNTYTTGGQSGPKVAAVGAGQFVVVWGGEGQSYLGPTDSSGVFGALCSPGFSCGPDFLVNTTTTGLQSYPAVAASPTGDFVVVWDSGGQDGDSDGIFAQRFSASFSPIGSEFQVNTYTTSNQAYPSVAVGSTGDFVVVWQSYDGSVNGVFGQRFDSIGLPLGTEFQVNTYTTADQYFPRVAIRRSGDFIVVWDSFGQDGNDTGVFGQRFSPSGLPDGSEFQVNTYTTHRQGVDPGPSVTATTDGNFVVAWTSQLQDGAYDGVFAQAFDSSGVRLGTEFQVNTFTEQGERQPAVAAAENGKFVIAWSDSDGTSYGTFAQRFSIPLCADAPRIDCLSDNDHSLLMIKQSATDTKDKVVFRLKHTPGPSDTGNPLYSTRFGLCVYDGSGKILDVELPSGGTCGTNPCWKDIVMGHKYADPTLAHDGVATMLVKSAGGGDHHDIRKLVAKGVNLPDTVPGPPMLTAPVTAQLVAADGFNEAPPCFSATYTGTDIVSNGTNEIFKAKH